MFPVLQRNMRNTRVKGHIPVCAADGRRFKAARRLSRKRDGKIPASVCLARRARNGLFHAQAARAVICHPHRNRTGKKRGNIRIPQLGKVGLQRCIHAVVMPVALRNQKLGPSLLRGNRQFVDRRRVRLFVQSVIQQTCRIGVL